MTVITMTRPREGRQENEIERPTGLQFSTEVIDVPEFIGAWRPYGPFFYCSDSSSQQAAARAVPTVHHCDDSGRQSCTGQLDSEDKVGQSRIRCV